MTSKGFIKMVRQELKDSGGKLVLQRRQTLKDDLESTGTFELDDNAPIITAAKKNKRLLWILIHEREHWHQIKTKLWKKFSNSKYDLEEILVNKKLKKKIMISLRLEMDVERRAIQTIRKLDLPINPECYSREANVILFKYYFIYLGFYPWLTTTDEQFKKLTPYMPSEIVSMKFLKQNSAAMYEEWIKILN